MECENCAFWFADVDEKTGVPKGRPYCHYSGDDQYAPCVLVDIYEEPEHDEFD